MGADLKGAEFDGADLQKIRFDFAILDGASLKHANLDGANLCSASLEKAKLNGARLEAASLLTQEQLDMAIGDDSTLLPEGLTRPPQWLVEEEEEWLFDEEVGHD